MLSSLRHCHLVALIGYCNDGQEMILVYEYMPNGTLEYHLHDHGISLSWERRLKICIGAARGLDYLHTGTGFKHGVLHHDVKSSNILLEGSWESKISDFGLSKIFPKGQPATYVNTIVKGTFGYLDPDYFYTGNLTRKSDVYAFGVVLFEVLCGKRAVDRSIDEEDWGLARWAQDSIKQGRLKQIIDTHISGRISPKCLKNFAQLANQCLHSHPKQRPTMAEIVAGLESVLALQEKANSTLQPTRITIFGRMVPKIVIPSNEMNNKFELGTGPRRFSYRELARATNGFSKDEKLGVGGLGNVYRGFLKDSLMYIAVKRVSKNSTQGIKEFAAEITIISRLSHRNLVQLTGWCHEKDELLVVYEFMENGSLDSRLFKAKSLLAWGTLYKIAHGLASALLFLHEECVQCILHREIKSSNVMLDSNFNAKLGDFGLVKLVDHEKASVTTFAQTFAYMAPECVVTGRASKESDVYSFGVVALEIACGRKPIDYPRQENQISLVDWVWELYENGTLLEAADPRLRSSYEEEEIKRLMIVGLWCVHTDSNLRLSTRQIIQVLKSQASLPILPSKMTVASYVTLQLSS